jgi:hypothetical protein
MLFNIFLHFRSEQTSPGLPFRNTGVCGQFVTGVREQKYGKPGPVVLLKYGFRLKKWAGSWFVQIAN